MLHLAGVLAQTRSPPFSGRCPRCLQQHLL